MNTGGRPKKLIPDVRQRDKEEADPITGPELKRRRLAGEEQRRGYWATFLNGKQRKESDVFVLEDSAEVRDDTGVPFEPLAFVCIIHECACIEVILTLFAQWRRMSPSLV